MSRISIIKQRIKHKSYIIKTLLIMLLNLFLFQTAFVGAYSYNFSEIGEGINITKEEIGALSFSQKTGVDGKDVVVAVIDTGIDLTHPDLLQNSDGEAKVVDWKDFTYEGLVEIKGASKADNGTIKTYRGNAKIGNIRSRSGNYRYGFLHEENLDEKGYINQDLNRNGRNDGKYLVVLADPHIPNFYDTVYVDTNQNMDVSNEPSMRVYSSSNHYNFFEDKSGNKGVSFVITEINQIEGYLNIGFDGNGHGTHVAGIIGGNGKLTGVAPEVKLMSLKALSSSGDGSWESISKAMEYAAINGADIINISVGSLLDQSEESFARQSQKIEYLSSKYNTVFVIAAGNSGPGIGSGSNHGGWESAITVGSYISPEIWKLNYDSIVDKEGVLYFSAMGPKLDGSLNPDVIAPGSVVSTVPLWDNDGYFMLDGTSMSAPHVSGGVALLVNMARKEGLDYNFKKIKRAIQVGARSIEGFEVVEQGYGLINIENAYEYLQSFDSISRISPLIYNEEVEVGRGLYLRDREPVNLYLSLTNLNQREPININFDNELSWIRVDRDNLILPRGKNRKIKLNMDIPREPGIYSGLLSGSDRSKIGNELEFMTTIIRPIKDLKEGKVIIQKGNVQAARWKRYFIEVPSNMEEVVFNLEIPKNDNSLHNGRARMHVINPSGKEIYASQYIGKDFFQGRDSINHRMNKPEKGIWEVVIYSDPRLSNYGLNQSEYILEIRGKGLVSKNRIPLNISVSKPDEHKRINKDISLYNYYKNFEGEIKGIGLAKLDSGITSRNITVTDSRITNGPIINVPSESISLEISLSGNQSSNVDIDLYLYYYNEEKETWEEVAHSATMNEWEESIEIFYPKPGRYIAYIDGYNIPKGSTRINYKHQVLLNNNSIILETDNIEFKNKEKIEIPTSVNIPSEKGQYIGYLIIQDTNNDNVIFSYPINVTVKEDELFTNVIQTKSSNSINELITISFWDKNSAKKVESIVTVNGKLHETREGKLNIFLNGEETEDINLIVEKEQYAHYRKKITIDTKKPYKPLEVKKNDYYNNLINNYQLFENN